MSSLQDELVRRFNALVELEDPEKFFTAYVEYLRFVQETPPLPSIARRMFADGISLEVGRFYKAIQDVPFVDAKMIWADTHRQILGLPREYDTGLFGFMMPMPLVRTQARLFNTGLKDGLKQWSVRNKIRIIFDRADASIFMFENPKRCYPIKSRGKYVRKEVPQRFQIILALPRDGAGFSAERLATKVKIEDVSNLRKEIREINKNFAQKVSKEGELIADNGRGSKKIYSLNTETYDFEFK